MTDSEKFDLIFEKLDALNEKCEGLNDKFDKLENDVTDIKMALENEIRVNVQKVAEAHYNLSRKLHEAMKHSIEAEMLAIKVRMLETDMMEIKSRIS
jgi:predicted nucleic acid-binding protein